MSFTFKYINQRRKRVRISFLEQKRSAYFNQVSMMKRVRVGEGEWRGGRDESVSNVAKLLPFPYIVLCRRITRDLFWASR